MKLILLALIFPLCTAVRSNDPEAENYFSIGAHLAADAFSKSLRKTVRAHLRVDKLENLLSSQPQLVRSVDGSLTNCLSSRLDDELSVISASLDSLLSVNLSLPVSCYSIHDVIRLDNREPCHIDHDYDDRQRISTGFQPILNNPFIRRQFGFANGYQFEFPAQFLSAQSTVHWQSHLAVTNRNSKTILFLVDYGHITSDSHLDTVRAALLHLLSVLSSTDRVSIATVGSARLLNESCRNQKDSFKPATDDTVDGLRQFVGDMRLIQPTFVSNHSFAMRFAVERLAREYEKRGDADTYVINYISRGVLSELAEAANVMHSLREELRKHSVDIRINTLLIGDEKRNPVIWSSEFLASISAKNFSRYRNPSDGTRVNTSDVKEADTGSPGEAVVLNGPPSVVLSLRVLENMFGSANPVSTSVPLWRVQSNEDNGHIMVTLANSFGNSSAGVQLDISSLLDVLVLDDEFLLAPAEQQIQLFLCSLDGVVVDSSAGWRSVPLWAADQWPVSSRWLLGTLNSDVTSGDFDVRNKKNEMMHYEWVKLSSSPFALFLRTLSPTVSYNVSFLEPQTRHSDSLRHVVWHEEATSLGCWLHGHSVRPSLAAIYLPPSAYLARHETSSAARRNAWIYLTDQSGLFRSPLRDYIREEAVLMVEVAKLWIGQQAPIVRIFASSLRGTTVIHPAMEIEPSYEPTRQKWFVDALSSIGSIVISGPRLDPILGDIITISTAVVMEGHDRSKQIFGVIAMEVPSSYLQQILADSIPNCSQARRCILFTPDGDVLYANDDSTKGRAVSDALERYHVASLEPLLASQMTRNNRLVTKEKCLARGAEVRRHRWQLDYTRVHTTACGDVTVRMGGAVHSEVLRAPNSSVFLAIVNSTCMKNAVTVFCPCSVHDRRCLFCGRFDSVECECPCQCGTQNDYCHNEDPLPHCEPQPRNDVMFPVQSQRGTKDCKRVDCATQLHPSSCQSIVGCEWCRFDSLGAPARDGRCTDTDKCYQGVEGRSITRTTDVISLRGWSNGLPVGPLTGGLFLLAIFLGIAVWCYKTQFSQLVSRRTLTDERQLFTAGTNYEFDADGAVFKEVAEKLSVQLCSFEREAPVARRPAPPSDHGYSTMTDRNTNDESASPSSTVVDGPRQAPPSTTLTSSLIVTAVEVHPAPPENLVVVS